MENEIINYLDSKWLKYKLVNSQIMVYHSQCCGDEKPNHFYINYEWLWDCKKCTQKGNYNEFRALFWDLPVKTDWFYIPPEAERKPYRDVPKSEIRWYVAELHSVWKEALDYLTTKRWLSVATLQHFKIWVDWRWNIKIPSLVDWKVTNIKTRKSDKDVSDTPRYWHDTDANVWLFNEDILSEKPSTLFITEGEMDAMTLFEHWFTNVVWNNWWANFLGKDWKQKFKDVKELVIVYDTDKEGKDAAKKLAAEIWLWKCKIVELPEIAWEKKTDVNDYFQKMWKTKTDFENLLKTSAWFSTESVKHISEFNDELRKKLLDWDYTWVPTGIQWLDDIMWGYRKWRLIILSALTSIWKTTLSENLTLSLANRNKSVHFVSMEMPPIDICKRFLMLQEGIKEEELKGLQETDDIMEKVDGGLNKFKVWNTPIYLFNWTGTLSLEEVLTSIRVAKKAYNIEMAVIDHLHYFWHTSGNRAAEIASITREIKWLAMELEMPILLLAHLNRWGRTQQRRWIYMPTLADLKDAWAIEQDADQVLFLARDNESTDLVLKKKCILKLAKNRDGATWYVSLDFDLDIWLFTETIWVDYMEELVLWGNKKSTSTVAPLVTWVISPLSWLPF